MAKELKYLLLPQWKFENLSDERPDYDIPTYFLKLFSAKKEIEEYLNSNDIYGKLHKIKCDAILERIEELNFDKEKKAKMLSSIFKFSQLTFWVISINPIGKENRIGIMQSKFDEKEKRLKWKYFSYFGGKVWKDDLLCGGVYR